MSEHFNYTLDNKLNSIVLHHFNLKNLYLKWLNHNDITAILYIEYISSMSFKPFGWLFSFPFLFSRYEKHMDIW